MKLFYDLGILLYGAVLRVISPFNSKARLWITGRKNWERSLQLQIERGQQYIWVHCASLGEFEQGRPVIEAIKKEMPTCKVILTFFSPSGYEVRKNYSLADVICYLPADTPRNSERFISVVRPAGVIFVKYEFWHNYISALHKKGIPLYLISGIFRSSQPFFRWYGMFFRKMLCRFTHIFLQDQVSAELLRGIGVKKLTVAGDTRFDRVVRLTESAREIHEFEVFRGEEKLFIAGSSWHQDEEIMAQYINSHPGRMKWVFAPHEPDRQNIERLEKLFTCRTVKFSEFQGGESDARVLIIDNVGMLSSAYRYAYIAAVGGGFGKGIHNVLEPACWGIPVMFGPNHEKFREAVELLKVNGARTFKNLEEFTAILETWLSDGTIYLKSAKAAALYVSENKGATAVIMREITSQVINNHCS
ncbi:MAG: glycosyltransferase N-terminal domain-containing protein [Bacteroidales bacterium]|jgi:3-deoxy-D-manno-octulosonic-acid transferase|nr:glycosyltransferase N-terminal domain-containing protein [Bacteroidales bacterium]